uniref:Retrotransposon gag domain-containing protein n=1 Tax=Oryza brachyantha TaxID=4533 RepID=J3N0F4_ORYBR
MGTKVHGAGTAETKLSKSFAMTVPCTGTRPMCWIVLEHGESVQPLQCIKSIRIAALSDMSTGTWHTLGLTLKTQKMNMDGGNESVMAELRWTAGWEDIQVDHPGGSDELLCKLMRAASPLLPPKIEVEGSVEVEPMHTDVSQLGSSETAPICLEDDSTEEDPEPRIYYGTDAETKSTFQLLQVLANNQGGRSNSAYGEFMRAKPPTFAGYEEPMKAEDWLRAIEKKLALVRAHEKDKVIFTTNQPEGTATDWWDTYK